MFKIFNIQSHEVQASDFFAKSKCLQCFASINFLWQFQQTLPLCLRLSEFNLDLNSESNWNRNTRHWSIPESLSWKTKNLNINMPQISNSKLIQLLQWYKVSRRIRPSHSQFYLCVPKWLFGNFSSPSQIGSDWSKKRPKYTALFPSEQIHVFRPNWTSFWP